MRRLILFRHAKSAWPAGIADRDRPLAPRGLEAAPAMGAYMAQQHLVPERALVSPARRTVETWLATSRVWADSGVALPWQGFEERIYAAPAALLLAVAREGGAQANSLMLVGHNPGMEDLLALLAVPGQRDRLPRKYPTAGLAVIDLPADDWADIAPGTGTIERFFAPRMLGLGED
ncbi:histidine phosphatase family protein [Ancylobacter sp. 6x-1]|uniref:Histidine phosphatase family protein n=1 Tax=Ancylobacter crimeensis TaxID=2579147 RepID=A0ABT0DA94_9HYPH|nr:histidine phosphatase family protein [Ancylobacter crimeensis]MCK0196878.1 histidine phosphatase family protein [Ancylobacter crimeensis]